jgi:cytosine/adenosine deaminase-related metal-dependent hydrolase
VLDAHPLAERRDLGQVALIPGLINAHTHLELSWMAENPPPAGDWVRWVRGLLARRAEENRERALAAAACAAQRMIARGTVAVGDVGNRGFAVPVLAASELAGVAFLEVYGLRASQAQELVDEATARIERIADLDEVRRASDRLRVVLTPHAPHTTSPALLTAVAARAAAAGAPLSIHLAESPAEGAFLRDGTGPFADFLRERGMAQPDFGGCGCSPVAHLARLGLLSERTLAVHCVHLAGEDVATLRAQRVTVVTCPRSNATLGVGTAPLPALLDAGVRVALGTDSLASVGDLDLFAEMAAVAAAHRGIPPATVLRMATADGAAALGLADRLGSIESGKLARLVVVPLGEPEADPARLVCSNPAQVFPLADAPWRPGR